MSKPAQKELVLQNEGPAPQLQQQLEGSAILSLIERAAKDPQVDIDKMQRLLDMRKQMMADEAQRAFDAAMSVAQGEMRPVAQDANNPQTRSKYASYFALDKAVRPIYSKHGFSISYDTDLSPKGADHIRVLAYVRGHGHREIYKVDMPVVTKGIKGNEMMTPTHATSSANSYGRRFLLGDIFNIAVGADDDGNAAGKEPISEGQAEVIKTLIVQVGADIQKFLKAFQIEKIEDLASTRFQEAKDRLEAYGESKKNS